MSFHIRLSLNFICFYNKLYNILLGKLRRATFLLDTLANCLLGLFTYFLQQDISISQIHPSNDQNHPNQASDSKTQAQCSCKEVHK